MKKIWKSKKWRVFFSLVLVLTVLWNIPQPSHDRTWIAGHTRLPQVEIDGDLLHVKDIRDFEYKTKTDFEVNYKDQTFDLAKLKDVWFVVSHFAEFEGAAHTLLSFEFDDGEVLAISIEARMEEGEDYSTLWGAMKNFELIYVAGTEDDLLKLRTDYRDETVYFYPAKTTPEKAQKLLLSFANRINRIHEKPEFYNTFWNNCTNQITAHIKEVTDKDIPFTWANILPGYADEFAYRLDFIPNDKPLEKIRTKYQVDKAVKGLTDNTEDFSAKVRAFIQSR